MDVDYDKTGPCNGKLKVTVPQQEVEDAFAKAYRSLAKEAKIPGFRPGKAPRHVLEAHFGDRLKSDVENDLVRASLSRALDEKKLVIVTSPRIDGGELKRGEAYTYTAEIETQPEIELKKYEGLAFESRAVEVTEADVEEDLEKIRQQAVQLTPVLDRDFIKPDDLVLADYEGTTGGSPLSGAKAENTLIDVGHDDFIPGMSDGLMGAKVPGKVDVPVDFPADHPIETWRGAKATFHVTLKELKKKDLPALDDEFAKDVGEGSLGELRDKVRKAVQARKEHEAKVEKRKSILQALVDANPFAVPPSLVSEQVDRMIIDAATRVRMMMGPQFNLDNLDIPGLREKNRDAAEFQVRSGLLLLEVSKAAGLAVEPAEVDAEVERIAASAGDNAERARAQYNGAEEREQLKYRLLEDRTIQYLLDHAAGAAPAGEAPSAT